MRTASDHRLVRRYLRVAVNRRPAVKVHSQNPCLAYKVRGFTKEDGQAKDVLIYQKHA